MMRPIHGWEAQHFHLSNWPPHPYIGLNISKSRIGKNSKLPTKVDCQGHFFIQVETLKHVGRYAYFRDVFCATSLLSDGNDVLVIAHDIQYSTVCICNCILQLSQI